MAKKKSNKSLVNQRKKVKISLNPLREQLKILVDTANERVDMLLNSGVESRALYEAQRTLKIQTSRTGDDMLFRSDLKTRKQINREFQRVHTFLNDMTSTSQGAENFGTDLARLTGAFGGQWKESTGENYDTSRVDKETATRTFDLYRRVIERAGGWERAVGLFQGKESLVGYGSENLIIAIYDMVENSQYKDEAIIDRAADLVEQGIKDYQQMAEKQVKDYDYGIVFDDEQAQARRNFYIWRRQYRKEK